MDGFLDRAAEFGSRAALGERTLPLLDGWGRGDLCLAPRTQEAPGAVTLDTPRRKHKIQGGRDQLVCQEPHTTRTEPAAGDARRQPGQFIHGAIICRSGWYS